MKFGIKLPRSKLKLPTFAPQIHTSSLDFLHIQARNPRESIPTAIVTSIVIVTVAYVGQLRDLFYISTSNMPSESNTGCASVMTLVVPYKLLDEDAGLVQIWGQVG